MKNPDLITLLADVRIDPSLPLTEQRHYDGRKVTAAEAELIGGATRADLHAARNLLALDVQLEAEMDTPPLVPLAPCDLAFILGETIALTPTGDDPGGHTIRGLCALLTVDHTLAQRLLNALAKADPDKARRVHALVVAALER